MSSSEQDKPLIISKTNESQPLLTFCFKYPSNDDEISKFKDSLMNQQVTVKIIEIRNCPTTSDASKLLSNSIFRSALELFNNFIILKLEINEKLNGNHAEKPRIHEFNIARNFWICFESIEDSQKIFYWKHSERFIKIKLIEKFSSELTEFVRNFLIDIVDTDSPHFDNPELIDLIDSNGCNLLMKAVDAQQTTLIDELLDHPFYINKKSKDGKSAADIAWEKKNFEILILLLEANSTFPEKFDQNELDVDDASNKIEEFIKISNEMHKAIKGDKSDKVLEIINENPNLSCFYNSSNVSAAAIAIKSNKPDIYKLLIANECMIGPEEDFNEIIEQQNSKIKSKITSTHDSASKELEERHLMILLTNSVLCHDNDSNKLRRKSIKEAFNVLNEIPLTEEILKLTAMHKNFKIRFDFNRTSVEFMNPSGGNQSTRGLFQKDKSNEYYIYIGANYLLDKNQKFAAIGTLAHELCHFAMDLIFINDGKPYAIDDEDNRLKFDGIIAKCSELKDIEQIVSLVFNYDQNEWPSELIVRVPHMIAHYHNDSNKLNELKPTFKDLFDYYDQVIEPNIHKTQSLIKKVFNDSFEINYNNLTDAYKAKIHNSSIKFQGAIVKLSEIIEDKNSKIFKHLKSQNIRELLIENKSLTIGCAQDISASFYINRNFVEFNKKLNYKCQLSNGEFPNDIWNQVDLYEGHNFDEVSSIAVAKKMILLLDDAGAGKTTTFEHLTVKLKEKFPNYWTSFIDLKQHLNIYEKFKQDLNEKQVLEVLRDILKINDKLELEIFEKLFNSNKVILLLDGVDEISPIHNEFFMKFIDIIYNSTNNQQWIATRPQHTEQLAKKFNQTAYKFEFISDRENLEFIKKNVQNQQKINDNDAKKVAEDILKIIYRNIQMSYFESDDFHRNSYYINSLLLLKIITEIYLKDKTALESFNTYSLYEEIIALKKKEITEKGEVVIKDCDNEKSRLTVWQVHQIYALKLLYYHQRDIKELNKTMYKEDKFEIDVNQLILLKMWNKSEKQYWTSEAISRYGFLTVDKWNTKDEYPNFVHRTFAEFFIARYLIENIYKLDDDFDKVEENELNLRMKVLVPTTWRENSIILLNFLKSFLKNHKRIHQKVCNYICTSDEMDYKLTDLFESYDRQDKNDITGVLRSMQCLDDKFISDFRFGNNETLFQKFLQTKYVSNLHKMIEFYANYFGDNWPIFIGYQLSENFSMPNNDEIRDYFGKEIDREVTNIFYIYCLIEQLEIPQNHLFNFFEINFSIYYRSNIILMGEKMLKIIRDNFSDCKWKICEILKKHLCGQHLTYQYLNANNEDEKIAANFCRELKDFLSSEKDMQFICIYFFIHICDVKSVENLHQNYQIFTTEEIQNFFIEHSCLVIRNITESASGLLNFYDNLDYFRENFFFNYQNTETGRNQLANVFRMRYDKIYDSYFSLTCRPYGHTVLSFLEARFNEQKEYEEKYAKIIQVFVELAKIAEISAEEIKDLSKYIEFYRIELKHDAKVRLPWYRPKI